MRYPHLAVILLASVLAGGCLQSATLVRVNADGSGTVEERLLLTKAAVAQLTQLAAMGGEKGKPFDPFSEEDARKAAADLGPDVKFVSSTPIKTETAEGRSIVYAFTDINRLRVNQSPAAPGGMKPNPKPSTKPESAGDNLRFSLQRSATGSALLTITMPPFKMPTDSMPGGDAGGATSPEQLAMVKQLFAGMRIVVAVQPAGRIIKSSSPYVDGQTVTLLDVPVDQLMNNEAAFGAVQRAKTVEDLRAALKGVPGLKVALDPEITIEFTAK